MPATEASFPYRAELDGMRGLAIILVLFFHLGFTWCPGGFIGVDIFFVLSGFLITILLAKEHHATGAIHFRNFYARRILRLFPALLLMLAVFLMFNMVLFDRAKVLWSATDVLIALVYLTNWTRVFHFHPFSLIGHTWSLAIEEQFYLVWPVALLGLMRLVRDRHRLARMLAFLSLALWGLRIALTLAGMELYTLFHNSGIRADGLLLGGALGVLCAPLPPGFTLSRRLTNLLRLLAPLSLAALLTLAHTVVNSAPPFYLWGQGVVELATGVLILDLLYNPGSLVRWLFTTPILVWLGTLSYGLYLWHYPIFMVMQTCGIDGFWVRLLGTPAAFAAATLSRRWLEVPVLRLKDRFQAGQEGRREG